MTLNWLILATLVSEDLACIAAGLMVAEGAIGFLPATSACMVGILIGDLLLWFMGRYMGRTALRLPMFRRIVRDKDLRRTEEWFQRGGLRALFACRFVPGMRLPMYFAAGVLRSNLGAFAACLLLAGAVWTPMLVGLAALAGGSVTRWFGVYRYAAGAAVGMWAVLKVGRLLCSWRSRRLLLSRWRRLTRWEFWSLWAFYPPVVLYILWLATKHRSLSLFTAANPAIPGGGFLGESKSEILRHLPAEFVPRYSIVNSPPETYPVVLKPDVGQRGLGVAICRTREDAERYFSTPRGRTIAQEYVPGHEFGVFYYRYPNEDHGHIFSITEKRPVAVRGDGIRTLEELILADARAVCMAHHFLRRHASHLDRIPAEGEVMVLAELGTHCRGAVFADGTCIKTSAMERKIDEISRCYQGFYFGRYDIRTPSLEEFQQGRNFKIIELNGVASEATHIYDPGARLLPGWRTLMEQWRICFEIGAQNRIRGAASPSVGELASILRRYEPAAEA